MQQYKQSRNIFMSAYVCVGSNFYFNFGVTHDEMVPCFLNIPCDGFYYFTYDFYNYHTH